MSHDIRAWIQDHRHWVISLIIIITIVIFALSTKLLLLANFLLGNDIVIELEASQQHFLLERGEIGKTEFTTTVTTNPFCEAICETRFFDLSGNETLSSSIELTKPTSPTRQSFVVHPYALGEGQRLYQYQISCKGTRTLLCHTQEEPTRRTVLITADYQQTEEEEAMQANLSERLTSSMTAIADLNKSMRETSYLASELREHVQEVPSADLNTLDLQEELERISLLWKQENLTLIASHAKELETQLSQRRSEWSNTDAQIQEILAIYNSQIESFNESLNTIARLSASPVTQRELPVRLEQVYNDAIAVEQMLRTPSSLSTIQNLINAVALEVGDLNSSFEASRPSAAETWIFGNVACANNLACIRANESTCNGLNQLIDTLTQHPSPPIPDELRPNVTSYMNRSIQNLSLPTRYANHTLFFNGTAVPLNDTRYLSTIILENVDRCTIPNLSIEISAPDAIGPMHFERRVQDISFEEPPQTCCVMGSCEACCLTEECRGQVEDAPVVFVHGHAFNKETSSEYSLDAFNDIQEDLSNKGFIDAGAITLYTEKDIPQGTWGKPSAPLLIKLSYYFDIFAEPENYVVVPTKSENIDTYAIRLKDLLDTVEYNTGRPKARIVAHSMGGLVVRRYMQIFGTDGIESIVFIATPHQGIEGNIAEFCPIIGEQLECRDLQAGSLFMRKLNSVPYPDIPTRNIIGMGCEMSRGQGDGIVLERNAQLDEEVDFYVEGSCSPLNPLHTQLLDVSEYPEVMKQISEAFS